MSVRVHCVYNLFYLHVATLVCDMWIMIYKWRDPVSCNTERVNWSSDVFILLSAQIVGLSSNIYYQDLSRLFL